MEMDRSASRYSRLPRLGFVLAIAAALVAGSLAAPARAQFNLDELPVERWKELREVERHQLNIAQTYFAKGEWKVAQGEYEKFLKLYETSSGAPHAMVRWGVCLVNVRKPNTAIKDCFQSVLDYFPDSAEAQIAAYYIGRSYQDMGEVKKAKKAYKDVMEKFPGTLAYCRAALDLVGIAAFEKDDKTKLALLNRVVYDVKRTTPALKQIGLNASLDLADFSLRTGAASDAVKALATSYPEPDLPHHLFHSVEQQRHPIGQLVADEKTQKKGEQTADLVVAYIRQKTPTDMSRQDQRNTARAYLFFVAEFHKVARQKDKAIETYEQMHRTFAPDDEILGRLAEYYKGIGEWDKARETFRRYEKKIDGLIQVAYSYRQQKNVDEAIKLYRLVIAQDPQREIYCTEQIAATYYDADRFLDAINVYTDLLKLDTARANSWQYSIAYAYHRAGKYKEAIGNYRQVVSNDATVGFHMADCHRALGQFSEAILHYGQIVTAYPASAPQAALRIAQTQEQAGKKEAAIKAFQHVCRKYPQSGEATQSHVVLENTYKISFKPGGGTDEGAGK